MSRHGVGDRPVIPPRQFGVFRAELPVQLGRSLDVREKERDRAVGKCDGFCVPLRDAALGLDVSAHSSHPFRSTVTPEDTANGSTVSDVSVFVRTSSGEDATSLVKLDGVAVGVVKKRLEPRTDDNRVGHLDTRSAQLRDGRTEVAHGQRQMLAEIAGRQRHDQVHLLLATGVEPRSAESEVRPVASLAKGRGPPCRT